MAAPHLEPWRSTTIGGGRRRGPDDVLPAATVTVDGVEAPGTLEVTLDEVPTGAAEVAAWIRQADDPELAAARARAARDVEEGRDGEPRKTVLAAVDTALGDGG